MKRGSRGANACKVLCGTHGYKLLNMFKAMNENVSTIEQVPIVEQLRTMEVGSSLDFPIEKTDYLRTLTGSRLFVERANGSRWSVITNLAEKIATVTRVS